MTEQLSATPEIPDKEPKMTHDVKCACGHAQSFHYAPSGRCMKVVTRHYSGHVDCTCKSYRPVAVHDANCPSRDGFYPENCECSHERGITEMTESKSDGINQEDASLLLGLSTTRSTAPVTDATESW